MGSVRIEPIRSSMPAAFRVRSAFGSPWARRISGAPALLACAAFACDAGAQEPPIPVATAGPEIAVEESELSPDSLTASETPSPLGALFRSMAIPGWGHAYAGARTRAGVYLAFEVGSAYAIIRTRTRLNEVDRRIAVREGAIRDELASYRITHSEYVNSVLAQDSALEELEELKGEREQQVEDWIAFGGFMFLVGAVDAYVSTHLQDVPDFIELEVGTNEDGRLELGLRVPIGR